MLQETRAQQQATREQDVRKQDAELTVSFGSGWITPDGYIVTNNPVVRGAANLIILLSDGRSLEAIVKARDAANDLAILSVSEPSTLPAGVPSADKIAPAGASVFTIGYPHPALMGTSPKVSEGIVNSVSGLQDDPRTYQISVPLQAGNSGSPILNMRGEAIGIATSKLNAAEVFAWTGDLPENVNYAIKVAYAKPLLQSLPPARQPNNALPDAAATLEELVYRIKGSVVLVINNPN